MYRVALSALVASLACGCNFGAEPDNRTAITMRTSAMGREADVLAAQLDRFHAAHPTLRVDVETAPAHAGERHDQYAESLRGAKTDPDVLQLDMVWAPEFADAGWLAPLGRHAPVVTDFLAPALAAATWKDEVYALPWFVAVGMLYYRSDIFDRPPAVQEEIPEMAYLGRIAGAREAGPPDVGLIWPGNRDEGLIPVFVEYLGAYGGAILAADGTVSVDSPQALAALRAMRRALDRGEVPRDALTWDEEKARSTFQSGKALLMRNWPYAIAAMNHDPASRVKGKFAVTTMPPAPGGRASAALGGQLLAISRTSDQLDSAYELIRFLTTPEEMAERARFGAQFPARRSVYGGELDDALGMPAAAALDLVDVAIAPPVTPLYAQLSVVLQTQLHLALSGKTAPQTALAEAAREIRALLAKPLPIKD